VEAVRKLKFPNNSNIQKDGNMAKEYQVKAVVKAIERLQEEKHKEVKSDGNTESEKVKTKEKKYGEK
jgi:hypothetical protein